ncbi:MAG: hypothetical protein DRI90_06210 [Deltaproteobacteria bacterium]|nr:MAG: hypothetical protein DRI90_06210 [Deltaproteobacteria bacterium]
MNEPNSPYPEPERAVGSEAPAAAQTRHPILESGCAAGPCTRIVDELVIHHEPTGFRRLCEQVVTPETRYIVFDLDRTVHVGRNLGELLGWEVNALASYGEDYLQAVDEERRPSRFIFEPRRPAATARYLTRGARLWAYPGLLYLFGVKLGTRSPQLRPWLYRHFGRDPVEVMQDVPRTAMMHHLSEVPIELLRTLAERIWQRFSADQVVQPEHVAWLRRRCPGVRIILSSASPLPVVEVAARELGVDDWFCTEVEERDGYLSSPFVLDRRFQLWRWPRRLSPPSLVRVNAGVSKMAWLHERYPDFRAADVETVGVTDTSYGEDGAWTNHFKQVIDINSPNPFAPIVFRDSPLRAIHSAQVMSWAEHQGEGGERRRTAPGRHPPRGSEPRKRWLASELASKLDRIVHQVEQLAADYRTRAATLNSDGTASRERVADWLRSIERDVVLYNSTTGAAWHRARRRLQRDLGGYRAASRHAVRLERPLASLTCQLDELLEVSRQSLG